MAASNEATILFTPLTSTRFFAACGYAPIPVPTPLTPTSSPVCAMAFGVRIRRFGISEANILVYKNEFCSIVLFLVLINHYLPNYASVTCDSLYPGVL